MQRVRLLVCDAAIAEMKLRARPFLRKKEVETGRLGAERPGAVEDPHADFDQVAPLLPHGGTQHDSLVGGPDRLVVTHLHPRGDAAGPELAEDDPTADLVGQRCLNASVQRIHPTLVFGTRMPDAHDFIAVFVKFHPQSLRTVRIAAVAMVTVHAAPRIRYLFHNMLFDRCGAVCSVI